MRFLILGGTAWLGNTIATAAMHHGHKVTCLARGESGDAPAGIRFERGDRSQAGAYAAVADEDWDVVVDVARQPGQVASAVAALRERAASYTFVSSGNVYAGAATPGQDETGELLRALDGDVMESMDSYGEAKVACEQRVVDGFGADRALIARPGLIGGPGDVSDRSGYWPLRFNQPAGANCSVLVPDVPGLLTQVLDVRDLAEWIVDAAEDGTAGVFNAAGETVSLAEHLAVARGVAGHSGPIVGADAEWLQGHDVQPWSGPRSMPLWLPLPDFAGFNARDSSAARAAGLVTRPLAETLADTLYWERLRVPQGPRRAGISDTDEAALLAEYAAA
ncbi:NAD-dependent epimerase/dehydratase family protein [Cryobacterium sp. SO2]|uniref:NAD-dependent epimerase/dehydratase family protein n=1 Tax=Cryobacterium sp. SO2 TaxID=1897060 RepID=UPI00223CD2C9|nr:NAD-dependent epimerase/dehydratase family protein [Cryobacterium sp. SO2]WEO75877.1 NAD-dependent epimerase/dehydratase family protein [Cryobacterium sp. SO2]